MQQNESRKEQNHSSGPEDDWTERLAYEASDEFAEQSGSYQEGKYHHNYSRKAQKML